MRRGVKEDKTDSTQMALRYVLDMLQYLSGKTTYISMKTDQISVDMYLK